MKRFDVFDCSLSADVWDSKYRFRGKNGIPADGTTAGTMYRVATAIFRNDESKAIKMAELMREGKLVPAGRIISGAGTGNRVTMMNCYVMGKMKDSLAGIMATLNDTALTMQQGGGTGTDFSPLRPMGAILKKTGSFSSGPMPFMDMWHAMCSTIMSAGHRRGAMMGTMRIDHPDILSFITAKQTKDRMTNFNVSVLVTDLFMEAVKHNTDWQLISPHAHYEWSEEEKQKRLFHSIQSPGATTGMYVWHTMPARELWNILLQSTYEYSEPGVIFVDRINHLNNLRNVEEIACTNPCGEQPLPPFGACNLGHVNLAMFVKNPWAKNAHILWVELEEAVALMAEFLDNVIDETLYPLEAQREEQMRKRRIGLGVTGLADMLSMVDIHYGSREAENLVGTVMKAIARATYKQSINLAATRGPAPIFNDTSFNYSFAEKLGPDIVSLIRAHGIRNGVCLTVAPTGTTSVFYGNVSSGIEPVFAHRIIRKIRQADNSYKSYDEYSFTVRRFAHETGCSLEQAYQTVLESPSTFPTVNDLTVEGHLRIMSAVQEWVDASVSKTINLPTEISFEDFKQVYSKAYELGCKGCTTYRPSDVRGSILESADKPKAKPEVVAEAVSTPHSSSVGITTTRRSQALEGRTYKFKWPSLAAAMYITINHDDTGMPTELFIHSKNAQFVEWSTALSVMITKLLQASRDPMMVALELKQINLSLQPSWENGTMYGSIIARIGAFIEEHYSEFEEMQFIGQHMQKAPPEKDPTPASAQDLPSFRFLTGQGSISTCSFCGSMNVIMKEGCLSCNDCGNSKCN